MKLQKVKSYKLDKNRWQYKYQITIPEESIDQLGWKEGLELQDIPEESHLRIEVASNQDHREKRRVITTKLTYAQFRDQVKKTLEYQDNGMTWSQIREKLGLDQVVPNNKWVRQLEKDIGLERVKQNDNVILWRTSRFCNEKQMEHCLHFT